VDLRLKVALKVHEFRSCIFDVFEQEGLSDRQASFTGSDIVGMAKRVFFANIRIFKRNWKEIGNIGKKKIDRS